MSPVWVAIVEVGLTIGGLMASMALGYWLFSRWVGAPRARRPSVEEIELEALRSAARLRAVSINAEQYMDDFIETRERETAEEEPFIVEGEWR